MGAKRKQLLLDDSFILSLVHGGEYSVGKRKIIRPVSTKKPMHLTLRSSFAIGRYSFRVKKNRDFISKLEAVDGLKEMLDPLIEKNDRFNDFRRSRRTKENSAPYSSLFV